MSLVRKRLTDIVVSIVEHDVQELFGFSLELGLSIWMVLLWDWHRVHLASLGEYYVVLGELAHDICGQKC